MTVMLSLRFLTILSIPVLVTAVPLEMTHSSDSDNVSNGKTPDIKELSDLPQGHILGRCRVVMLL